MIRDRSEELSRIRERYLATLPSDPQETSSNGHHPAGLEDDQVVELVRQAKNAAKFERLHSGDASGYNSQSEADQALISILAFYTQDEAQLDRLYRRSGLCRDKWMNRPDYRQRTIKRAIRNLAETYSPEKAVDFTVSGKSPIRSAASSHNSSDGNDASQGSMPEAVRLSDVAVPGPRRYLLESLIPESYVTLLHGDGGVAKSTLALALAAALASENSRSFLGKWITTCPVGYLDFELDASEQTRRLHQMTKGAGLGPPPRNLFYISALGFTARQAFTAALQVCQEHGIKLLVLDSLGPALQGDAEASRDVIGFFQEVMEPFRAAGVSVLIIDHQSKLQRGENYQSKSAFGSVFKSNLARSVIQVEAVERGDDTLTVRLRQKKHNFGPLCEPFGAKLTFEAEQIKLEPAELEAAELAEEQTLNAKDRVKLALEESSAYPWELAERTGLAAGTVKNALTGLRKQGLVEPTGEVEGRAEQVRLAASSPSSLYRDRDDDDANLELIEGVL